MRFHTLPLAQRYAVTPKDAAIIQQRQRAVLEAVAQHSEPGRLSVILRDHDAGDQFGGWSRAIAGDAWPWRVLRDPRGGEDEPLSYFWVQQGPTEMDVDRLLHAAAEDRGELTLLDDTFEWLVCPYDGGIDVIARSMDERDQLAEMFSEWIPTHDDPTTCQKDDG